MITTWINSHCLSCIVFAPLLLSSVIILLPKRHICVSKWISIIGTLVIMITAFMYSHYLPYDVFGQKHAEYFPLLTIFNASVDYYLALDKLNIWFIVLTTFLVPIIILNMWRSTDQKLNVAITLLLMLETSIIGALAAQDLMVFYVFWSAAQLLIFFTIGIWGNNKNKYVALIFMTIAACSSLPYLMSMLFLAEKAGSFNVEIIAQTLSLMPINNQFCIFLAFTMFFAIGTPLFPFCSWLPELQANAPVGIALLIIGVFAKLGSYGFLKFILPIFPKTMINCTQILAIVSILTIIHGTIAIIRQTNIKKIITYYSISQMGFVMLVIISTALSSTLGATMLMCSYSLSASTLFVGIDMLCSRNEIYEVSKFNKIINAPILTVFSILILISSIIIPIINMFANKHAIIDGIYQSHLYLARYMSYIAMVGIIFNGLYVLWITRHMFFNKKTVCNEHNCGQGLKKDISFREAIVLLSFIMLTVWIGIYPKILS